MGRYLILQGRMVMGGPLARHRATRSPRARIPHSEREVQTRTSWRTLSGYAELVPSIHLGFAWLWVTVVLGERDDWEPRLTLGRRRMDDTALIPLNRRWSLR